MASLSDSSVTVTSSSSGVRPFSFITTGKNNDNYGPSHRTKRLKTTGQEEGPRRKLTYGDKLQTNDEIHQSIEICPVMKAMVDTQVFQRLRHIRQLGTSQYVYMCGDHNRFQHSLGVAHLAEKMCRNIKSEQPALGVTEKDVLCVKLAGLLHDVGHGPFSHLYEAFRDLLPRYLDANTHLKEHYDDCKHLVVPKHWSHEDSSLIMVDAALAELGLEIDEMNLDRPLKQIESGSKKIDATTMRVFRPPHLQDSILTSRDFIFIKECIYGKPLAKNNNQFIGRQKQQLEWLYDIVNNRHSGLDVDKIDYYARDRNRTIGSKSLDIKMIEDARVAKALCSRPEKCPTCDIQNPREHFMICYPRKRTEAAMTFFQERLTMHSTVYQHKKGTSVSCMLLDIFCLADPFLRLRTKGGEVFPMSKAAYRSDFLLQLKDDVLALIEHSIDERLRPAQAVIERMKGHDMYKCAVDIPLNIGGECSDVDEVDHLFGKRVYEMDEFEIQSGIMLESKFWNEKYGIKIDLDKDDFIVNKYCMHHGAKAGNPLDHMRFFDEMNEKLFGPIKDLPTASPPKLADYKCKNPTSFQKVGLRIYVREESKRGLVNQVFNQWFEGVKKEAHGESHITPGDIETGAQNDDEGRNVDEDRQSYNEESQFSATVPLSQESVDGDGPDDDDDFEVQSQYGLYHSPIPMKRSRN